MKNKKKGGAALTILLMCVLVSTATAQSKPITLQAAIDSAMKQNQEVMLAALQTRTAAANEKTAWEIPAAEIGFEAGQINSYAKDTRFTVAQSFDFPLIYSQNSKMLRKESEYTAQNELLTKLQVRKAVTELYYRLLLMQERKKMLLRADSLYAAGSEREEIRFKAGESNLLEKTAAETQRMQIANQVQQLDAEFLQVQMEFARLMNSQQLYIPVETELRMKAGVADTSAAYQHPAVQMQNLNRDIAKRRMRIAKYSMLPGFTLGYYNMSITGWQVVDNADIYYNSSYRFSSFAVGISIPLFFGSGLAKTRVAGLSYQSSELAYINAVRNRQNEIARMQVQVTQSARNLNYYETSALKNANVIESAAAVRLGAGEISFTEWMLLTQQAVSIRMEYLNAIEQWNNSVIGLNAATGKL